MAVNISKVEKLTGSSGPISFSQIRDEFGGNTTNVRASLYRRNDGDNTDWDGPNASKIEPKIPDATENQDISSTNNWNVSTLRNTVMEYNVTQSGTDEEVVYYDADTSTWNGNLNRNILKKFDVTGTVFANETSKDALTFEGNLYNLEIEVDESGAIYGEGGSIGNGSGSGFSYHNGTLNHVFNNTTDQTITLTEGGVIIDAVPQNPTSEDGTFNRSLNVKHYLITVDRPDYNDITVSNISSTTAGGGSFPGFGNNLALQERVNDTQWRLWFAREKNGFTTYVREFTITGVTNIPGSGSGGDALYVNNTKTNSPVEIYAYGSIWSGGGGGFSGNRGNSGGTLNCSSTNNYNANNPFTGGTNLGSAKPGQSCRRARSGGRWQSANQNGIRNRCRGGGTRRGSGDYPGGNYQCSSSWTIRCIQTNNYNLSGGSGGNAGSGGRGRGFSYQNGTLSGNSGNSGNTNSCSGGSSRGNSGNPGTSGGDWGQSGGSGAPAGIAIQKKNAVMKSYSSNTVKGSIVDI